MLRIERVGSHYIMRRGKDFKDLAELLISRGADVNAEQEEGMTPLHIAARNGNAGIIAVLISKGAAIEKKDRSGHTSLYYSVSKNHVPASISLYRCEVARTHPALASPPLELNIDERYRLKSHSQSGVLFDTPGSRLRLRITPDVNDEMKIMG